MIDGQQEHEEYDVARDVRRYTEDRARGVMSGAELSDTAMREAGGVVITPLASILLEHVAKSHVRLATAAVRGQLAGEMKDTQSTLRRLVEYIGVLESIALLPYSVEQGDSPWATIEMAAGLLEQQADEIGRQPDISQATIDGVAAYRWMALRLRATEARMMTAEEMTTPATPDVPALPVLTV